MRGRSPEAPPARRRYRWMLIPLPSGAKTPLTSRKTTTIATSATTMTAMIPDELLCSTRIPPRRASGAAHAGRVPDDQGLSGRRLAQLEPLDLAGRRLRQLGDELDPARVLVRRERIFDESLELIGERGRRRCAVR